MITIFPIPANAKPHEVAIIDVYARLRSCTLVARFLHYKTPRQVNKVIAKYKVFLIREVQESPVGLEV